jgi:hypothetical protein
MFGLMIFTGFSAVALAMGRTPEVVGRAVSSSNATVEGTTLLSHGTILSGDTISVGEGGSVLLSFSPPALAALSAATNVRFSSAKGEIVTQLLSGALGVKRGNKGAFVVNTSAYRVEPRGEGRAEFLVSVLPDERTIVEAQQGQVTITEISSGESYTLGEGLGAEIPASATGFPGQGQGLSKVIGIVTASTGATKNGSPRLAQSETPGTAAHGKVPFFGKLRTFQIGELGHAASVGVFAFELGAPVGTAICIAICFEATVSPSSP